MCCKNLSLTLLKESSNFLHTVQVVSRCRSPNPCLHEQDTVPYAVKISVISSWRWAKNCPKHVELILEINKLLLHLVGSSILFSLNCYRVSFPEIEICRGVAFTPPPSAEVKERVDLYLYYPAGPSWPVLRG